ncbi:hypothetical protein RHS04_08413 [Rhizoctonia solani]|uniref:Uncharacterized protein n=1 Tax=Rhizoctonia solani TaxID=456999 RepID=A0A8H7H002_9AGAM|nr:hypothetical protein RHS04_08413 [Rhizoctonia solani]
MATSTSLNIAKHQTLAQNNPRRRPIRIAADVLADSATNLGNFPGLKESAQAAGDIFKALKGPVRNDIIAQGLINYLDEICYTAQYAGADEACPEYLEDLQQTREAVVELKNKTYGMQFACQYDIEKQISKMKEEMMMRALLLSVEGGVSGLRANAQAVEIIQQLKLVAEALADVQEELAFTKRQVAQQSYLVNHMDFCPLAMFGNLIDIKIKVYFILF